MSPIFRKFPQFESDAEIPAEDIPDLTEEAEIAEEGTINAEIIRLGEEINEGVSWAQAFEIEKFRKRGEFWEKFERKLRTMVVGALIFTGGELGVLAGGKAGRKEAPLPSEVKPEQKKEIDRLMVELKTALGKEFENAIQVVVALEEPEMRAIFLDKKEAKEAGAHPKIQGFEEIGVDNEFVRHLIETTLPNEWTRKDLGEVGYSEEQLQVISEYGLGENTVALAFHQGGVGRGRSSIVFNKPEWYKITDLLNQDLAHEIAHSFDPINASNLPPLRRLQILDRLVKRVKSPDRFQVENHTLRITDPERAAAVYPESIQNPDTQKELLYKSQEYWAVIFQEYLTDPIKARYLLPPADFELIEDYLAETSPQFDAKANAELRKTLLSDFEEETNNNS